MARLYSTDPRRSAVGEAACAASSPASRKTASSGRLPRRKRSDSPARSGVGPALVRPIPA